MLHSSETGNRRETRHRSNRATAPGSGQRTLNSLAQRIRIIIPFLLIMSLFTTLSALAQEDPTLVSLNDSSATLVLEDPITDGEFVVWRRHGLSPSSPYAGLHVAPIAGGEETPLLYGTFLRLVAIDNGYLVVLASSDECIEDAPGEVHGVLCLIDLASNERRFLAESFVTSSGGRFYALAIDYPTVAWAAVDETDDTAQLSIMAMNIEADFPPSIVATEEFIPDGDISLYVEGDLIRWVTTFGSDDVGHAAEASIGDPVTYFMSIHDTTRVDLEGTVMVTLTEGRPLFHDLASGEKLWLEDEPSNYYIATDGRYVFWSKFTESDRYLMALDTITNARFRVWTIPIAEPDRAGAVREIDAHDGVVTWSHWYFNDWQSAIHGTPIADQLPSAYQASPGTTSPEWTYYPETGHYLAHDFRNFWDGNGGLPVFGYPMTEEFDYLSPETGDAYAAQMTERQRFEWHPENIGTPYAVLLGRLGETILQEQGRDWTTFEKADPSAEHYFDATGHAIAPEFYAYWSTHGLDLGHSGVSFDESLALFGYPLSEPMMETNADGDTVLTQYFERAVFEFHPDNPESSQVLLRRLGAELLDSWGW